jgi:uncharacterized integral membrane protein
MYRLMLYIFGAVAILAGLLIGTLNSEKVALDLLWLQLDWPLGVILVISFATGLLLGLAALYLLAVIPLRISLRKKQNVLNQDQSASRGLTSRDA